MNSEMAYCHSFKRQACKLMSFKDGARLNQRYFAPVLVLLKSKNKIGGNHAFFKDNSRTIFVKSFKNTKPCMGFFLKLNLNYL